MTRFLLPTLVIAILIGLLWFGFGRNPGIVPDPLLGRAAPAFRLRTTEGRMVSLRTLRGHPLVLSFFASWCTSCREEEGNLVQAYRRWGRKARFLGVIYEDSASAAAAFTKSHGGSWPDLIDPHSDIALAYGVSGLPTTFFINSKGVITGYTFSLLPTQLDNGIRAALYGARGL